MKNFIPGGKYLFQPGLKYYSLEKIENLMKVRRLNQKRAKNKSKQRWLQQKVEFCNS